MDIFIWMIAIKASDRNQELEFPTASPFPRAFSGQFNIAIFLHVQTQLCVDVKYGHLPTSAVQPRARQETKTVTNRATVFVDLVIPRPALIRCGLFSFTCQELSNLDLSDLDLDRLAFFLSHP